MSCDATCSFASLILQTVQEMQHISQFLKVCNAQPTICRDKNEIE